MGYQDLDKLLDGTASWQGCVMLGGSAEGARRVRQWWQQRLPPSLPLWQLGKELAVPDFGQYASCGLDRLCAGVAALALLPPTAPGVVVVDCGTATTVTAWAQSLQPAQSFQGGLILPGAHACATGLQALAPALPRDTGMRRAHDVPSSAALARSTSEALCHGLSIGYPAMVQAAVTAVQTASGLSTVMLDGGSWWTAGEVGHWQHVEGLNLRGLWFMARPALAQLTGL